MKHKFYNMVRVPCGSPDDNIIFVKGMRASTICNQLNKYSEDGTNNICGETDCNDCIFDHRNKRHFEEWSKNVFKGLR